MALRFIRFAFAFLAVLALSAPAAGQADAERISWFLADVTINDDGSLSVVETIRFHAAGQEIKRGLVRQLPLNVLDGGGGTVSVTYAVKAVTRDGVPEPFHLAPSEGVLEIFIGSRDVLLDHGSHEYVITYAASGLIVRHGGFSTLRYDATGRGWSLAIDMAEARIRAPQDWRATLISASAGAATVERSESVDESGASVITARMTTPLAPGEGLTLALMLSNNTP
ncbi:MAG TPA: DUF2207 domain-containing protein [Micropepsaceae bacterium]|nr:DUF2207 domain-containing protein [Micropepsaceae bacterium]